MSPFAEELSTAGPAVLPRDRFWGDAVFVGPIWVRSVEKKSKDDLVMPVRSCEMERG